ncbi:diacylglycerol kinase family protein [Slackia heliotrinireducens]|uniref:diacylglycerol kinase family protein n=1 Tax=Slackia heliotrinireducens TaxID=84110 RepID=UPI003315D428
MVDQVEHEGRQLKSNNNLLKSFGYAFAGLKVAAQERNFKIDLAFAVFALVVCGVLRIDAHGWLAVILCIGAVLSLECVNTAIEAAVDLASPDIHPLAKRAKDCGAAAPLIAAMISVVVGLFVWIPALIELLQG